MRRRRDPEAEARAFDDWWTDSVVDAIRAEFGEAPHAPVEDWARDHLGAHRLRAAAT